MKLMATESGRQSQIRSLLIIGGLVVAIVIIAAIISEVYLPVLFGGSQTVNSTWVTEFINGVDAVRVSQGNSSLKLLDNLTTFAELRATNLTSHYENPYFGFKNDSLKFFGPTTVISEVTIYPDNHSPGYWVNYLQQDIPTTWQYFLTNSTYGYAIANGPYYSITNLNQCKVLAIPSDVTNMTQYLESQGCEFEVNTVTWLIFELSK